MLKILLSTVVIAALFVPSFQLYADEPEVRPELETAFNAKQEKLIELVAKAEESIADKAELKQVAEQVDATIKSDWFAEGPEELKDIKVKELREKLSAEEYSWYKQLELHYLTLNRLLKLSLSLQEDPVGQHAAKIEMAQASAKIINEKLKHVEGYENLPQPQALDQKAIVGEAFVRTLFNLKGFATRDSLKWDRLLKDLLVPLQIKVLQETLVYFESNPRFDVKVFSYEPLRAKVVNILKELMADNIEVSADLEYVLMAFAKYKTLHPLIRLTAYRILEEKSGKESVVALTQFDDERLSRFYRMSATKVYLHEDEESGDLTPMLSNGTGGGVSVTELFSYIEPIGERLELKSPEVKLGEKPKPEVDQDLVASTTELLRSDEAQLPVPYDDKAVDGAYFKKVERHAYQYMSNEKFGFVLWKNGDFDIIQKGRIIFQLANADAELKKLPDVVVDLDGFEVTNESTKTTTYYLVGNGEVKKVAEKASQKHFVRNLREIVQKRSCGEALGLDLKPSKL